MRYADLTDAAAELAVGFVTGVFLGLFASAPIILLLWMAWHG
jgi:hypothetical protein